MANVNSKNLVLKYEEMKHFSTENEKNGWKEPPMVEGAWIYRLNQENTIKCF